MNFQWRRAQCHFGNYRPPIETGANWVAETYPFPAMLSVFSSRRFAMPSRRCLLNETAPIIGAGMDEITGHNPSLKSYVMKPTHMKPTVSAGEESHRLYWEGSY